MHACITGVVRLGCNIDKADTTTYVVTSWSLPIRVGQRARTRTSMRVTPSANTHRLGWGLKCFASLSPSRVLRVLCGAPTAVGSRRTIDVLLFPKAQLPFRALLQFKTSFQNNTEKSYSSSTTDVLPARCIPCTDYTCFDTLQNYCNRARVTANTLLWLKTSGK